MPSPSWNELNLLIFPEWILRGTNGAEEFSTSIVRFGRQENRNSTATEGWQRLTLGGGEIQGHQELKYWNTFRAITKGAQGSFLIRNIYHCRMEDEEIGTGDGVKTEFQLCVRGELQDQEHVWPVKYPDHNYPPRTFPDGRVYTPTNFVQIFLDGVEVAWGDDWDVDRNTGIITFYDPVDDGVVITATGWFFTRVRFSSDWTPIEAEGGATFEIPASAELIEVDA
jgi:hypothetical protein